MSWMSACIGGPSGEGQEDDTQREDDTQDVDASARLATQAQARPRPLSDEQLRLCVGAAAAASQLSGSNAIVVTGTVDTRGPSPTYSASPRDALVLRTPDFDVRFVITRMFLSAVDSISEVFVNDHDIACRAARDGAYDLTLASRLSGRAGTRRAEGRLEELDRPLQFAFDETSTRVAEIDGSIATFEVNSSRSGSASGDVLDVRWSEQDRYLVLVGQDALENSTTDVTFDADVDGLTFAIAAGRVRRSFRNGAPAEPDFWAQTTGTLTHEGNNFGDLAFRRGTVGEFEVVLTTPDGVTVLEAYAP